MPEKAHSNLLEVNSAVGSYLDDMLHEATRSPEPPLLEEAEFDHSLLPDALLREAQPVPTAPTVIDLAVEKSNALVAEIETEFEVETEDEPEKQITLPADLFPLQCLMFKVAGSLLSIPLIEMQGVVNWTDNLTRLPQEPDWMLGILKHREHNIRIVDSVKILQIKTDGFETPAHVLVLGDEKWGITCDQTDEVVTLEFDDIQWHEKTDNTMTLGTIRDSLASLLSPQGIIHRLESGT